MKKRMLITGGAGFIGSNASAYFLKKGYDVLVFDNFQRFGTKDNAKWLKANYPTIDIVTGDIRNLKQLQKSMKGIDIVIHLAAQVAVTTSVIEPRNDFDINALGTFNVLEAVRLSKQKPIVIFSSTNKVYGGMEDIKIVEKKGQYIYKDFPYGISEKMNLDFHSPYGCSKGAADQYIHDYGRIYDIPTVVCRQSCIYGPRQFGIEDQGWVAWFIIATTWGKPISVYGDGKQVRDVLYVDDLIKLYDTLIEKIRISKGKIYNIGGGATNILSVWTQFGTILQRLFDKKIKPSFANWRPGDQKVYISDIRFVQKELGWSPKIGVEEGIEKLFYWVKENKMLFKQFFK
jgi:CDP-paratose 2-epimerase